MLTNPELIYWPINSIAAYCRRERKLFLSDASWYKYAKLLGIKRPWPESRRKKNKTGIRAIHPNQYWHADVSVFKINNVKHYIYLVSDNFSRRILSWKVSNKLSATLRVQTVREAHQEALHHNLNLDVNLIVDGGSENNNHLMDQFIREGKFSIHKLIALKDIHYSNSLVEAHFSLIKYNYLYRMKIKSIAELHAAMEFLVKDFNTIRPHGSLNGSTPDEAYFNGTIMPKTTYEAQIQQAKALRIEANKRSACKKCQ